MNMPLLPPLVSRGDVLAEVNGALGIITLNRPQALNALTLPMVRDIGLLLHHWQQHPSIQAVALLSEGGAPYPAAFCCGDDIHFLCRAAGDGEPGLKVFFDEQYALIERIHTYPKPTIALMDGISMGSGLGLGQGAKLRVLNERSQLSMQDPRHGVFSGAGGGFFLGQCPGATGEWLALTGQALGAGDAINLGLGDVFVLSTGWGALLQALKFDEQRSAEHVVATIMDRAELAPEPQWQSMRGVLDRCFGQVDLAAIQAELNAVGEPWAQKVLRQLCANSPLAMAVNLDWVRRARGMALVDVLKTECMLAKNCLDPIANTGALEGMRALI